MTRGNFTYQEIISQGEIWQHTLDAIDPFPSHIYELLQKTWSEVIFTGCGSTYYLSISASALWNFLTDITSRFEVSKSSHAPCSATSLAKHNSRPLEGSLSNVK